MAVRGGPIALRSPCFLRHWLALIDFSSLPLGVGAKVPASYVVATHRYN